MIAYSIVSSISQLFYYLSVYNFFALPTISCVFRDLPKMQQLRTNFKKCSPQLNDSIFPALALNFVSFYT